MNFGTKTFQGNSQYHRVLLGTAIAIQSNGTLLFLESTQGAHIAPEWDLVVRTTM